MKCKCYLNNNYEVIGLCDIEAFNKKTSKFKDNSWTEIIIPEELKLPKDKPSIKNIKKVFLNIKVTSDKIIKTPNLDMTNIEGLKVKEKILLVSGRICQKIIYTSDTMETLIHSAKFEVPFNTSIVLDESSDLENDKFCIYPSIEDISVKALDERTLSKSITLFLYTHKVETTNPLTETIKKLPNIFIFKNFNNNEMARIEFDKANKKLIVTSTNQNYGEGFDPVFTVKIRNSTGDKVTATINGNEDAENFIDALNDFDYEIDDKIVILSKDTSKVLLTNSPNKGEIYELLNEREQTFTIGSNELVEFVAPVSSKIGSSIINITNVNGEVMARVEFDFINKKLTARSTGVRDNSKEDNFILCSLNLSLDMIKLKYSTDPSDFVDTINNKSFNIGDFLTIYYSSMNHIKIDNYPSEGEVYIPREDPHFESFKIKEFGILKLT